jgi:hypothetical protein
MNVEIGKFPEKGYMNGIFLAVCTGSHFWFNCSGFPFDLKNKKVKKTILFLLKFATPPHSSSYYRQGLYLLLREKKDPEREGR